ncbi:MAG: hypothetical protein COV47_02010 [Candidatus Diapherotrites archaeon CG11_big_fil_rev_8_21_14_0_20_37_9]|nr:MAG: hypothetical protein COV47_02010 [Candidatus Diapherotrites archaeon CG11_big_fil_rev_8_21_14_0_20_37_9]
MKQIFVLLLLTVFVLGCTQQAHEKDFSLRYFAQENFTGNEIEITINNTGLLMYTKKDGLNNLVISDRFETRLTESNFDSLIETIKESGFMELERDVGTPYDKCYDADTSTITIMFEGKEMTSGGYCIKEPAYTKVALKVTELSGIPG